jgi:hypothetical protein
MNRQFRNLALAIGLTTASMCSGFGCAGPTGQDVGQSDEDVRHADVVRANGDTPGGAGNAFGPGTVLVADELNIASRPSAPPPDTRGPSPQPWQGGGPGDDHTNVNGRPPSSGASPAPNSGAPNRK